MNIDLLKNTRWDVIIIGSGIGGSTAALALGKAGLKVLVLEKGGPIFSNIEQQGIYAEDDLEIKSLLGDSQQLKKWGRYHSPLWSDGKAFIPFLGETVGGSSSLYGMAMELFSSVDFTPSKKHPHSPVVLPDWPISFNDLEVHYREAQKIFGVKGEAPLPSAPPFSPANQEIVGHLKSYGLNPYPLPMACQYNSNCRECQGFICPKKCKNSALTSCLLPAVEQYDVELITNCEVLRFSSRKDEITNIHIRIDNQEIILRAHIYLLAAGALNTPRLLLNSANLANSSGMVGRNLMRHLVDLYVIKTKNKVEKGDLVKQIAVRDLCNLELPLAYIHSFGRLPSKRAIKIALQESSGRCGRKLISILFPIVQKFILDAFDSQLILSTILEDLPYHSNRIEFVGEKKIIHYKLGNYEKERLAASRQQFKNYFRGHKIQLLKEAHNNERLAHACGTCRMGESPHNSVINADNRSHDVKNLYIVDSSFFPSSGPVGPSLTIAANSLRVSAAIAKTSTTTKSMNELIKHA